MIRPGFCLLEGLWEGFNLGTRRNHSYLKLIFLLFIFLLGFSLSLHKISNWDIWWHLRAGEYIWEKGLIPREDIFSFTAEGRKWIDHTWLFQAVSWKIYSVAGLAGLIISKALLVGTTFVLLMLVCLRRGSHKTAALLATGFALFILRPRLFIRPHIFTLLFLALHLLILESSTKRRIWLALLPLLMVIWVNVHGGFVAGFIVLFCNLAGFTSHLGFLKFKGEAWSREELQSFYILVAATLATIAATLLNPYTYEILAFPFRLIGQKTYMENIFEWMPLWRLKGFYLFWIFLFLTLTAVFFSWRNLQPSDILQLLVFVILAFLAQRHIELFVIIATPILARHITLDLKKALSDKTLLWGVEMRPLGHLINLAAILLLVFAGIWVIFPRRSAFGLGVRSRLYPEKAADFIKQARITGRMYNEYEWGGYLIWRFFPQRKVFMDGRTVVYGEDLYQDWTKISEGRKHWQETLDKYGVNFLIINYQKDRPASFWEEERWVPIYWDDYTLVAIRDAPENRSLIEKYDARLTSPTIFPRNLSRDNVQTIITKLEEKTIQDPECAVAHILLGRIQRRQGNLEAAIREYYRAIEIESRTGGPYYVTGAAYYFLAAAHYLQGYTQAAIEDCLSAIKFMPTNCDTYNRLGTLYQNLGETEKAQKMFEQAALCYFRRGLIQLGLGETEEAKKWLEQAAVLAPENEAIRAKLREMDAD